MQMATANSTKKLLIGNLPDSTQNAAVENLFSVVGRVLSQKLMLAEGGLLQGKAEPQHLEAALKVARHRRTEAAAGDAGKVSA